MDSPHPIAAQPSSIPKGGPGVTPLSPLQPVAVHNQPQKAADTSQAAASLQEHAQSGRQGIESRPSPVQNAKLPQLFEHWSAAPDLAGSGGGRSSRSPGLGQETVKETKSPAGQTNSDQRPATLGYGWSAGGTMKDRLLTMLAEGSTDDNDEDMGRDSQGGAGGTPASTDQENLLPIGATPPKVHTSAGIEAGGGVPTVEQSLAEGPPSQHPGDHPITLQCPPDTLLKTGPSVGSPGAGGCKPISEAQGMKSPSIPEGRSPGSGTPGTADAKQGTSAPTSDVEAPLAVPQGEDSDLTAPEVGFERGDPQVSSALGTQGTGGMGADTGGGWVTRKQARAEFVQGMTLQQEGWLPAPH